MTKEELIEGANKNNTDVHIYRASLEFNTPINKVTGEQRSKAKLLNFHTLYNSGADSLEQVLN